MAKRKSEHERHAAQAAGAYLYELLLKREQYYREWQPAELHSMPPTRIDQDEVAWVLDRYACELEEVTTGSRYNEADREAVRRRWKDKVSRALKGTSLTRETLRLFIEAFRMTEGDAQRLQALHAGREKAPVILGDYRRPELKTYRYEHETVLLHECHYVGANRQPAKHRTVQNVRSTVDLMHSYQFRYFTDASIDFEVVRGGVRGNDYRLDDTVQAIDILLDEPLPYGETASLEYVTYFKSPTDYPLYFNRAVLQSVDSLEICIVWEKPPKQVFWAQWVDHEPNARILQEQRWRIKGNSVHRSLTHVERAVFGFRWEW